MTNSKIQVRHLKLSCAIFVVALLALGGCKNQPDMLKAEKSAVYASSALVTPHPLSTQVGETVLANGGNAVDAAVAVQFAMAVVYPRAGNLGGGGFMIYRSADGDVKALDYRERAPAAANRDMYLDEAGEIIPDMSTFGHRAAGVPGTVAGIAAMYEEYGSMPWEDLIQPAIELARNGFPITQTEIDRQLSQREKIARLNESSPFLEDYSQGALFVQPDLATTLIRIRDGGSDGFYKGRTAELIVEEMETGGGLISLADLESYEAFWREPIQCAYRDYQVYAMPPASSGGVALCQMLGMLEPFPLRDMGFQSVQAGHATVEVMRRAYEDRAEYLGDTDYYPVPIDSILQASYLADKMSSFSTDSATLSKPSAFGMDMETFETTHISIVDAEGNAVSITTTLNSSYGCKVIVDGAGFFLNNEMDDFSSKPGVPNMFGLVGAEANAIAPGKRMLSSMTPTIVTRGDELFMVLGTPGGSTIITSVLQLITNVVDYDMSLDSAVSQARFHHQWLPDSIQIEPEAFDAQTREQLSALGHGFKVVKEIGKVKAIHRLPNGQLHAAADPRHPDDDVGGF